MTENGKIMSPENLQKGMLWNKPKTPLMLQFEKETGKPAIKRGKKITGYFEYWLWKKGYKTNEGSEINQTMSIAQKEAQNRPEVKEKKSKAMIGEKHPFYGKFGKESANWRGGIAEYSALHKWLNIHMPKTGICNICGLPEFYNDLGPLEKSNKTGKLIRDINNFQWAHVPCHKKYDIENNIIHEGSSK